MNRTLYLFLALLVTLFSTNIYSKNSDKTEIFKAGDNVCFIGNSITHSGHHTQYIALYLITRYPTMPLRFINIGVSGDTADGINRRMQSDVLPHKPDVSVLMIGMNDVGRGTYADTTITASVKQERIAATFVKYKANLSKVVDSLRNNSRELILFTPSIYDQTSTAPTPNSFGVNDGLYTFGQHIKSQAPRYDAHVVDMWAEMSDVNSRMQRENPSSSIIGADRVHPFEYGGFIMAYRFLKDTKQSRYVSDVDINARKLRVKEATNAVVTNLLSIDNGISFTMLEGSLPFPMDDRIAPANKYIDFEDEFNVELLRITNLAKGDYQITIDGESVGTYSSKELSSGVNLALNSKTPQYKQALQVAALCSEHRSLYSKYRYFKMVEHQKMKNFAQINDTDACIEYAREISKNENPNSWFGGAIKYYIENKRNQSAIFNQLQTIIDSAYRAAKPVNRLYVIKQI